MRSNLGVAHSCFLKFLDKRDASPDNALIEFMKAYVAVEYVYVVMEHKEQRVSQS